jgi:hypothetical protein
MRVSEARIEQPLERLTGAGMRSDIAARAARLFADLGAVYRVAK